MSILTLGPSEDRGELSTMLDIGGICTRLAAGNGGDTGAGVASGRVGWVTREPS